MRGALDQERGGGRKPSERHSQACSQHSPHTKLTASGTTLRDTASELQLYGEAEAASRTSTWVEGQVAPVSGEAEAASRTSTWVEGQVAPVRVSFPSSLGGFQS
jgi:hypothetical protein